MNIFDILTKLVGGSLPNLIRLLEDVATKSPDLAPQARQWIAALQTAASPLNLANVATAVARELGDIAQGKFKPRNHPGDAA